MTVPCTVREHGVFYFMGDEMKKLKKLPEKEIKHIRDILPDLDKNISPDVVVPKLLHPDNKNDISKIARLINGFILHTQLGYDEEFLERIRLSVQKKCEMCEHKHGTSPDLAGVLKLLAQYHKVKLPPVSYFVGSNNQGENRNREYLTELVNNECIKRNLPKHKTVLRETKYDIAKTVKISVPSFDEFKSGEKSYQYISKILSELQYSRKLKRDHT